MLPVGRRYGTFGCCSRARRSEFGSSTAGRCSPRGCASMSASRGGTGCARAFDAGPGCFGLHLGSWSGKWSDTGSATGPEQATVVDLTHSFDDRDPVLATSPSSFRLEGNLSFTFSSQRDPGQLVLRCEHLAAPGRRTSMRRSTSTKSGKTVDQIPPRQLIAPGGGDRRQRRPPPIRTTACRSRMYAAGRNLARDHPRRRDRPSPHWMGKRWPGPETVPRR